MREDCILPASGKRSRRNIAVELGTKILHNEELQDLHFCSISKGSGIA